MSTMRQLLFACLLAALVSTPTLLASAGETPEPRPPDSREPAEAEVASGSDEPAAATAEQPIQPPRIILKTQQAPKYPPAAKKARFEGVVTVDMQVLESGDVGEVKIVDCTHRHVGFEAAAQEAIKKWRFEPATQAGEPVEYSTRFRLNFRLIGSEGQVSSGIAGSQGGSTGTGTSGK